MKLHHGIISIATLILLVVLFIDFYEVQIPERWDKRLYDPFLKWRTVI